MRSIEYFIAKDTTNRSKLLAHVSANNVRDIFTKHRVVKSNRNQQRKIRITGTSERFTEHFGRSVSRGEKKKNLIRVCTSVHGSENVDLQRA